MQLRELKESSAQKEDIHVQDMRMLQETMHFKLEHFDTDITQATNELRKEIDQLHETSVHIQEATTQEFWTVKKSLTNLQDEITVIAEHSEETIEDISQQSQEIEKIHKRILQLSAQNADIMQKFDDMVPIRSNVDEITSALCSVKTELESKAASDHVEKISNQLIVMQRHKEGPVSFTWTLTKAEMDEYKHELRSPTFTLREQDGLQLKLHPRGRLTSSTGYSAVALVKRRQTTNPFEFMEEPLRVTFTCGSHTSTVREMDAWDDEFDCAVVENFVLTEELADVITVTRL